MALEKILGQNFRAFPDGAAVNEATSCECSITGNMQDSKTKDSEGNFAMEEMVSKSWQVNVTGLDAAAASLRALIRQAISMQTVPVAWDVTEGEDGQQNRDAVGGADLCEGEALLTDLTIAANVGENINISATYMGSGVLTIGS